METDEIIQTISAHTSIQTDFCQNTERLPPGRVQSFLLSLKYKYIFMTRINKEFPHFNNRSFVMIPVHQEK